MHPPILLGTWDPTRGVWVTDRADLYGRSEPYSATWPSSGMTRGGTAYAQPMPAHPTPGSGCSCSLGQPTPELPTPTTRDWKAPGDRRGRTQGQPLSEITALLPTPNAADAVGGPGNSGRAGGLNLRTAVTLFPTPTASDANGSGGSNPSNVTLTDLVVRTSLGATTNPRFDGGNT